VDTDFLKKNRKDMSQKSAADAGGAANEKAIEALIKIAAGPGS
jgi:hypothetical protein